MISVLEKLLIGCHCQIYHKKTRAINNSLSEGLEEYKPGEASQVMLDVLALSNSSMVERH